MKTKGTATQKGVKVNNVIVKISTGKEVRSQGNGKFSFPCGKKTFSIVQVIKKGYVLTDKDFPFRCFAYSPNELVITIEKENERSQHIDEAFNSLNSRNNKLLKERNAEIERLKKEGIKTQRELVKLKKMYKDEYDKNKEMAYLLAEKIVSLDYDKLDETNRQATQLISSGNVEGAKELLDQQGDNALLIEDVNKREESIASKYYNYYLIHLYEQDYQKATYYIERRANLDVYNINWQLDAGAFFMKRHQPDKAEYYFNKVLEQDDLKTTENPLVAMVFNNLGIIYLEKNEIKKAEAFFQKSLSLFNLWTNDNPEFFEPYIASVQSNLGIIYQDVDLQKSETYYSNAYNTFVRFAQTDSLYYQQVAMVLDKLGTLSIMKQKMCEDEEEAAGHLLKAIDYYCSSISIYNELVEKVSDRFQDDLARALSNLSVCLYENHVNVDLADSYRDEVLKVERQLASIDPVKYESALATLLDNYVNLCLENGQFDNAIKYAGEAVDLYRPLANENPDLYNPKLAKALYAQAALMYKINEFEKSKSLYAQSLAIYRELQDEGRQDLSNEKAKVLRNLAQLLDELSEYEAAGRLYQEEFEIHNQVVMRAMPDLARSYGNLANHHLLTGQFDQAASCAEKGLNCDASKKFIQSNYAAALLLMGNFKQAKNIYSKYKTELRQVFLDDLGLLLSKNLVPVNREKDVKKIIQFLNK